MKKLLLSFGACSLAFAAPVAIPTAAHAYPNKPIVEICKELVEYGYYKSVGDCANHGADFCNDLRKAGLLDYYGFKNQGDCVNYVKEVNDA